MIGAGYVVGWQAGLETLSKVQRLTNPCHSCNTGPTCNTTCNTHHICHTCYTSNACNKSLMPSWTVDTFFWAQVCFGMCSAWMWWTHLIDLKSKPTNSCFPNNYLHLWGIKWLYVLCTKVCKSSGTNLLPLSLSGGPLKWKLDHGWVLGIGHTLDCLNRAGPRSRINPVSVFVVYQYCICPPLPRIWIQLMDRPTAL